ncbi:uncharacterized protein METZ01_LOCUS479063, partial [marine metagenome]
MIKKILIHTMDHNKQYEYFRRLSSHQLSKDFEIYYMVHKADKLIQKNQYLYLNRIQSRINIEKRLIKISSKNKELNVYIKNRLLSLFFNKYKTKYDKSKLDYIDSYFSGLMEDIPNTVGNIVYIDNINNNKELIEKINPDLIVVVGAPFIRSDIVNLDCKKINLHIGYLPNYRGLKTIEWAVLNKDFGRIGYTIHELTNELDGGGIIKRRNIKVDEKNFDFKAVYAEL